MTLYPILFNYITRANKQMYFMFCYIEVIKMPVLLYCLSIVIGNFESLFPVCHNCANMVTASVCGFQFIHVGCDFYTLEHVYSFMHIHVHFLCCVQL